MSCMHRPADSPSAARHLKSMACALSGVQPGSCGPGARRAWCRMLCSVLHQPPAHAFCVGMQCTTQTAREMLHPCRTYSCPPNPRLLARRKQHGVSCARSLISCLAIRGTGRRAATPIIPACSVVVVADEVNRRMSRAGAGSALHRQARPQTRDLRVDAAAVLCHAHAPVP